MSQVSVSQVHISQDSVCQVSVSHLSVSQVSVSKVPIFYVSVSFEQTLSSTSWWRLLWRCGDEVRISSCMNLLLQFWSRFHDWKYEKEEDSYYSENYGAWIVINGRILECNCFITSTILLLKSGFSYSIDVQHSIWNFAIILYKNFWIIHMLLL